MSYPVKIMLQGLDMNNVVSHDLVNATWFDERILLVTNIR